MKDLVHVSPGLARRGDEWWEAVEIAFTFLGSVVRRFKCGKMT